MTSPTASPMSAHQRGVTLLLASTLAWSTAGLFVRMFSIDALSSLVWRGPAGALAILAFIIWIEGGRGAFASFARMRSVAWLYAGLSSAGMLCYIPALQLTTVAHVAIIYATVPFVAAALGYLILRERPSLSAGIASTLALAGVAIMVSGHDKASGMAGDLLALGMTLATASMMILGRRFANIPFLPAASASGLLTAVVALPFATQIPANPTEWAVISASGVINTSLGLGLFVLGSRLVPAIETALIGALEAPLAPLWVWLAFAETPSLATILGGGLVTAAVLGHLFMSERGQGPAPDTTQT